MKTFLGKLQLGIFAAFFEADSARAEDRGTRSVKDDSAGRSIASLLLLGVSKLSGLANKTRRERQVAAFIRLIKDEMDVMLESRMSDIMQKRLFMILIFLYQAVKHLDDFPRLPPPKPSFKLFNYGDVVR